MATHPLLVPLKSLPRKRSADEAELDCYLPYTRDSFHYPVPGEYPIEGYCSGRRPTIDEVLARPFPNFRLSHQRLEDALALKLKAKREQAAHDVADAAINLVLVECRRIGRITSRVVHTGFSAAFAVNKNLRCICRYAAASISSAKRRCLETTIVIGDRAARLPERINHFRRRILYVHTEFEADGDAIITNGPNDPLAPEQLLAQSQLQPPKHQPTTLLASTSHSQLPAERERDQQQGVLQTSSPHQRASTPDQQLQEASPGPRAPGRASPSTQLLAELRHAAMNSSWLSEKLGAWKAYQHGRNSKLEPEPELVGTRRNIRNEIEKLRETRKARYASLKLKKAACATSAAESSSTAPISHSSPTRAPNIADTSLAPPSKAVVQDSLGISLAEKQAYAQPTLRRPASSIGLVEEKRSRRSASRRVASSSARVLDMRPVREVLAPPQIIDSFSATFRRRIPDPVTEGGHTSYVAESTFADHAVEPVAQASDLSAFLTQTPSSGNSRPNTQDSDEPWTEGLSAGAAADSRLTSLDVAAEHQHQADLPAAGKDASSATAPGAPLAQSSEQHQESVGSAVDALGPERELPIDDHAIVTGGEGQERSNRRRTRLATPDDDGLSLLEGIDRLFVTREVVSKPDSPEERVAARRYETRLAKKRAAEKAERDRAERERLEAEAEAERQRLEAERLLREAEQAAAAEEAKQLRLVAPKKPLFPVLDREWRGRLTDAMESDDSQEVATSLGRQALDRRTFNTCYELGAWLNDEVILAYLELIVAYGRGQTKDSPRPRQSDTEVPRYVTFNTQFWSTLRARGVKAVERWTRRMKIEGTKLLEVEVAFIPINNGVHWTMCVVRPQLRRAEYYDSMGSRPGIVWETLSAFLTNQLKAAFRPNEWHFSMPTSPQQNNSSDCGVFAVTNAKVLMLGFEPRRAYSWEDMATQRRRILAEIMNGGFTGPFQPEDALANGSEYDGG